jgi:hypothetical protein
MEVDEGLMGGNNGGERRAANSPRKKKWEPFILGEGNLPVGREKATFCGVEQAPDKSGQCPAHVWP